ncbi:hypothetical protein TRV_05793 [Trichophyton verrucosum HKI 0517]|uniref:Uncharacterized protein n=1 Tax=Trichophyton verrucosum (strain HKI 0517) TaxID=663202 RepID=D4DF48_TRIVH|nr:uncharacterized protein TRV_05793 [Trichophyton verrucosum HKI 0517]EFE39534.1 hypothetical protein TRV_05793 [Trichophyton verrucosum HKI 0517]
MDFHSANCIKPRLVTMVPLMLNMRWTAPTRKELALYLFVIRTFYDIPSPRCGLWRPCGRLQLHLMSRNPAQPRLLVLLDILFFFHRASWLPRRTYLGFNSFLLTPIKGCPMSSLFVKIRRDDLTFQVGSRLYIPSNTQPKVSPGLQI